MSPKLSALLSDGNRVLLRDQHLKENLVYKLSTISQSVHKPMPSFEYSCTKNNEASKVQTQPSPWPYTKLQFLQNFCTVVAMK